jgi:hypothetical protein
MVGKRDMSTPISETTASAVVTSMPSMRVRVAWAERPAEQPVGHELLQPLAVQHIGLAPRDVLHMTRIDQKNREAARLQQLVQRDPVHAGGFHGDGVDAAGLEPIGDGVQVDREARKLAHRFIVAIRRHGHKVDALPMSMPAALG